MDPKPIKQLGLARGVPFVLFMGHNEPVLVRRIMMLAKRVSITFGKAILAKANNDESFRKGEALRKASNFPMQVALGEVSDLMTLEDTQRIQSADRIAGFIQYYHQADGLVTVTAFLFKSGSGEKEYYWSYGESFNLEGERVLFATGAGPAWKG